MLRRARLLLRLISSLGADGRSVSKTYLDKLLFLAGQETPLGSRPAFYHFYPHHYGPFSNNFYNDLEELKSEGLLEEGLHLSKAGAREATKVTAAEEEALAEVARRFPTKEAAVEYVYKRYPEYTVKSKLKEPQPAAAKPGVYTIGYEGRDIDQFLDALIQNRVEELVDVRANPFSMKPAFVGSTLREALGKAGIGYQHRPQLGIEGSQRKNLRSEGDYTKLFEQYRRGLQNHENAVGELVALGKRQRIALMCFEADKDRCHRGVLADRIEESSSFKVAHL